MHVAGPQIYQMNRQIYSFQNMCDMLSAKIDRLARKMDFLQQKKHLKIAYFGVHESWFPDFGRPWTPNGWHQVNLGVWRNIYTHEPQNFFFVVTQKLVKKCFFGKTLCTQKFSTGTFSGPVPTESLCTLTGTGALGLSSDGWYKSIEILAGNH